MKEINEIMTIKQVPVIEDMLDEVSCEIENNLHSEISSLNFIDEKSLAQAKKARANIRKNFLLFEERRKLLKSNIMKPYIKFEELYKEKIAKKFESALQIMDDQIHSKEKEIIEEKTEKIRIYFDEYCTAHNIKHISFEDMNLKVLMTGSLKSYMSKVKEFLDKVIVDLKVIYNELNPEDTLNILREYKQSFNLSSAILAVEKTKLEYEALRKEMAEINGSKSTVSDKEFKMSFSVTGPISELKKIKDYIISLNVKFE